MDVNGEVLRIVHGKTNQKKVPTALLMFAGCALFIFILAIPSRHSSDVMEFAEMLTFGGAGVTFTGGIAILFIPKVDFTLEIRTDGVIVKSSRGNISCIPYKNLHTLSVKPAGLSYYVKLVNISGVETLFPVDSNASGVEICTAISKARGDKRS